MPFLYSVWGTSAAARRLVRFCHVGFAWLAVWALACATAQADELSLASALESIKREDLKRHVATLADDTFEGREAGSRGGRAAGVYLGEELQRLRMAGGGTNRGYYQEFGASSRNVLALLEGSDPQLKSEIVIISAHYDHVGYGNQQNSFGPIGRIHNGADDNASGTAGLLEVIEACVRLEPPPKRSLLFAFWDGEEAGLLGSQHWIDHPTLPLDRVKCLVNADMIGRLRDDRVELYGTRTARGARAIFSRANQEGLLLDFTWEMKANSDHHTFFARGIPSYMLHTGLHDQYHRPSDDLETINMDGLRRVTRLFFDVARELADAPRLPGFRPASRQETPEARTTTEAPLPPAPGRLGAQLDLKAPGPGAILAGVVRGSAAEKAGLRTGDRVLSFGGQDVLDVAHFRLLALAAQGPQTLQVERAGHEGPLELVVTPAGAPVRIGFGWREDDADPGTVALTRIVPGSPAERAGLKPNDRIYEVADKPFANQTEFRELITTLPSPIRLLVERSGRLQPFDLELAPTAPPPDAPTE